MSRTHHVCGVKKMLNDESCGGRELFDDKKCVRKIMVAAFFDSIVYLS